MTHAQELLYFSTTSCSVLERVSWKSLELSSEAQKEEKE